MNNQLHCTFCHRVEIAGTEHRPCIKCSGQHQACKPCFKRHTKVIGEFPDYGFALNGCPSTTCDRCSGKTRSELVAEGKHLCHWPTCKTDVQPKLWGCKSHWFRLPEEIRHQIWAAYISGQEYRKDPSPRYLDAAREADRYARGEISAGRAS